MMGGDVTAESTLGAGTTFAIRLPAEVEPPAAEKAEARQPAEAEAAPELKSDPQLLDTPVIMVSMIDDKSMGYTLGAAEYLTKPVDRGRLVKLLHKYR